MFSVGVRIIRSKIRGIKLISPKFRLSGQKTPYFTRTRIIRAEIFLSNHGESLIDRNSRHIFFVRRMYRVPMEYQFTVVDNDDNVHGVITNLEDLQCCGFNTEKYTKYSHFDTSLVTGVLSLGMGNINEIEKPIKVGSIFSSAKHILACLEIAEAKEERQGYLRTARSQKDRVVFRCKVKGCPFCVRAQKKPLTIHSDSSEWFKITQYKGARRRKPPCRKVCIST